MTDLLAGCCGRSLANGLNWLNEPPEWGIDGEGLRIVPRAPSGQRRAKTATAREAAPSRGAWNTPKRTRAAMHM